MTVVVGLFPVLLFLSALIYLDSYKLVRPRWVVGAMVAGCVLAVACWFLFIVGHVLNNIRGFGS